MARYIEDIADCFCVAITDEGVDLRVAGITKPVLVFTPPLGKDDIKRAEFYGLSVTVNSVECAEIYMRNFRADKRLRSVKYRKLFFASFKVWRRRRLFARNRNV